ncbi:hypothetical protein D3C76_544890 [compost metagenome]
MRYALETYPKESPVPRRLLGPLKDAQSTLGDWHDYEQWLMHSERELDLMPLQPRWNELHDLAESRADLSLDKLLEALA